MTEIRSCCWIDNADNPNAPEYGKKWKPQHNAACGCSCSGEQEEVEENVKVIRKKLTREDFQ